MSLLNPQGGGWGAPTYGVMLDIPSQYMHYCLVLLWEVYCIIV